MCPKGFLSGLWRASEEEDGGVFMGHFFDRDRQPEEVLGGGYAHAPNRPGGFFAGRWAVFCDDNAAGSIE